MNTAQNKLNNESVKKIAEITAQIEALLVQRQELVRGCAGDGAYSVVSHEDRGALYKSYSAMINRLDEKRTMINDKRY